MRAIRWTNVWNGFVEGLAMPAKFVVWLWRKRNGTIEIRFNRDPLDRNKNV